MFEWKEQFSVNVKEIDIQHKRLFELGHTIFEILDQYDNEEDSYEEIAKVLQELKDYTIYHFKHEEKLMEKYNYQNIESHKKEHEFFINKISDFKCQDIYIKQDKALKNILTFLLDWITTHILKSDMKYKDVMNSQGLF